MIVKLHLFAVACVLALVLVSKANCEHLCETIINGNSSGIPHQLERKILPPYVKHLVVDIPDLCVNTNGLVVTICDETGLPDVDFVDYLMISRKGNATGVGTLDITEYCSPDNEASSKLVPIAQPVASK